ncbi:FUSC family protein [Bradyrhizobium sp. RT9b]
MVFPVTLGAFAIRIGLAAIVALYVSFWLSLEAPSTVIVTLAVVLEPNRG